MKTQSFSPRRRPSAATRWTVPTLVFALLIVGCGDDVPAGFEFDASDSSPDAASDVADASDVGVDPSDTSDGGDLENADGADAPDTPPADCPVVALREEPAPGHLLGLLPPLTFDVTEDGQPYSGPLELIVLDGSVDPIGPRNFAAIDGVATVDGLQIDTPGWLALSISTSGCAGAEVGPLVFGLNRLDEPVFLEGGRLGVSYESRLPAFGVVGIRGLPAGLELTPVSAAISGIPSEAGHHSFEAATLWEDDVRVLNVRLPVFDGAEVEPGAAPNDPGPFEVLVIDAVIPSIEVSWGVMEDVGLRVVYPDAAGPFPLIGFHHAAHSPGQIYANYTVLHDHWASHGFVVASVDGAANTGMRQSWQNLTDISTVQLAAIDAVLGEDGEGLVDRDRILVSGHSRGGGASLISLWRRPELLGAIGFEPVSPLQTPSQDWDDAARNADRAYPAKPILLFSAANDTDEPWPYVDTAYEQTVGPTAVVTIHGANHEYTYDEDTPGGSGSSSISFDERHEIDQFYSTAFLLRFAYDDLRYDSLLFGREGQSSDESELGVSVHGRRFMNTALIVDDFLGDADENLFGGANVPSELERNENAAPYSEGLRGRGEEQIRRIATWALSRRIEWGSIGASLSFDLDGGGGAWDLTGREAILLRAARACASFPSRCNDIDTEFSVVLTDAAGQEASVVVTAGMGVLGISGRHWSRTILDLADFTGVDMSALSSIELRFDESDSGDVWVDDLRFE